MLDTSEDLTVAEKEMGCTVEQLLTPLTRFKRQQQDSMYAIDNGAFSGFDKKAFLALLKREWNSRELCRFVAVPDVVANARRTLEVFEGWRFHLTGWKLALVMQDGQEDLPIPWDSIDAVFIGGSTEWKLSKHAAEVIRAAKALDKWVHAGRVNTPARFEYFERLGADSIDGTGLARYSWMRERIHREAIQPNLLEQHETRLDSIAS
jgi:hypothetical protein